MSQSQSEDCQVPQIVENQFATELHIYESGDECPLPGSATPEPEASTPKEQAENEEEDKVDRLAVPQQVVLSTTSPAALKAGKEQMIPKKLAVSSRPKNRHHTTVVTFPVGLENSSSANQSRHSTPRPDVSWDDYDSDGEGFGIRRNRRNQSYRAAIISLNFETLATEQATATELKPVREGRAPSPAPVRTHGRKGTLGRKRNQRQRGSFKDATPHLYQEIRERGLQSTQQDESLDESVVAEPAANDQGIVIKNYRPTQLTWSQLPQVKETGILDSVTPQERKRQEAIFEIITSEHSYLHSLGILVRNFKESETLRKTMTATEHHHLFSNIAVIRDVSQRFFEDLERRHSENPVITDISDIVQTHARKHFEPYISYCSNETFQQRTLQKLLSSNNAFKENLKQIEMSSECRGLPMLSFLILPMQRVTRLPLLLDVSLKRTVTFMLLLLKLLCQQLVTSCNDGARRMERTEQMYTIEKQMDFGKIKAFPLVSSSRWLKKRGELRLSLEEFSIWKAFSTRSYYLFVFSDVLIVTKKKSEESFVVLDYATLQNIEVEMGEDGEKRASMSPKNHSSYLSFRLLMSKNSEGRAEQISLLAESRYCDFHTPLKLSYKSLREDHLLLGWCYGERMRDGVRGWFPNSCATEITNPEAIESNVQRMRRLRKETNV
uniref:Rho guanine nucleotide exchange factor (GEF) 16 n=1 Tax=Oreochromis niloticus TaxID=8128 RepID=I3J139_ORENI